MQVARALVRLGLSVVAVRDCQAPAPAPLPTECDVVECDYRTIEGAVAGAREVASLCKTTGVHYVVCHAESIAASSKRETVGENEFHLATNHLNHFAFVNALFPTVVKGAKALAEGDECRVIVTTDWCQCFAYAYPNAPPIGVKRIQQISELDPRPENKGKLAPWSLPYRRQRSYCNAKLLNMLHARDLHRRAAALGVPNVNSCSVHPGFVADTYRRLLQPYFSWFPVLFELIFQGLCLLFAKSLEQQAATVVYCVACPKLVPWNKGGMYADCWEIEAADAGNLSSGQCLAAERMWTLSSALTKTQLSTEPAKLEVEIDTSRFPK